METTTGRGFNKGLFVAIVSLVVLVTSGLMAWQNIGGLPVLIVFLIAQVVVISIVIWQACDPFAEAAQYIGLRYNIPGSVRGATLDAIASSLPELFSGIFFVIVAVFAASEADKMHSGSDGFGAVVATCAGSAVYNMILIPAACALVISRARKERPTIDIAPSVIARDGVWFLCCELILVVFLFMPVVDWWMGVILIAAYVFYIVWLVSDARKFRSAIKAVKSHFGSKPPTMTTARIEEAFSACKLPYNRSLILEVRNRLIDQQESNGGIEVDQDETPPDAAQAFFGRFEIPLGPTSCWVIIAISTIIAAVSCYWLVEVTRTTASSLDIPIFFVAVIVAAAASSVPDTFLSIGSALRGDDDGAVSNAFGSNIFDICICLSIPLMVGVYLNGGQPISLTQDGQPIPGLVGIRILLCSLTVITLLIMWRGLQLTWRKAWILVGLYGIFVIYAILGSLGIGFETFIE